MGSKLSRQVDRWASRNNRRMLLVGLDGAGKTTILNHLRVGKSVPTMPTIGFNVETVKCGGLTLLIWLVVDQDVGGQESLRPYWRHHYTGTQGVVFVLDSADRQRFELARDELYTVISDQQLEYSTVLILVNKQDLPDAASAKEIEELFELPTRLQSGRKYKVVSTVATTGAGISEGIEWLCQNMDKL